MSIGTRSLLFGLHQLLLHPFLMIIAYLKLFQTLPSLMELTCIMVHDWGYFGCEGIDSKGGEKHPYLGASIAHTLFGEKGWRYCIGHNDDTAQLHNILRSRLYAVDKYYYVLIPTSLHRLLAYASGEYREIQARGQWDPAGYKASMKERFASGDIALLTSLPR